MVKLYEARAITHLQKKERGKESLLVLGVQREEGSGMRCSREVEVWIQAHNTFAYPEGGFG